MEDYIRESKPIIYGLKYNNLVVACHFKEKIIKKLIKQEASINHKRMESELIPFTKHVYYSEIPAITTSMVVKYNNILLPSNLVNLYVDYEYRFVEKFRDIKLDLSISKYKKDKSKVKELKRELKELISNYNEKISIIDLINDKELRDRYEFYLNSNEGGG